MFLTTAEAVPTFLSSLVDVAVLLFGKSRMSITSLDPIPPINKPPSTEEPWRALKLGFGGILGGIFFVVEPYIGGSDLKFIYY